jgi:hypothetical protein
LSRAVECRNCEALFVPEADGIRRFDPRTDLPALEREESALKTERFRYQLGSFLLGLPGLLLIFVGFSLQHNAARVLGQELAFLPTALALTGAVLFCLGIGSAVLYKCDNAAWALLCLLGIVGYLVLVLLPDEKGRRLKEIGRILDDFDEDEEPTPKLKKIE